MNGERNIRSRRGELHHLTLTVLLLLAFGQTALADSPDSSGAEQFGRFGSPDSVQNQLESDRLDKGLFEIELFRPYHEWKDRVREKYGYSFGLDYYPVFVQASDSLPGEDDNAASGVFRFSGFWELLGRGTDTTGTLIYLVEHRHEYTETLPSPFLLENVGYAGFTLIPFTDDGWHLTNLHWIQSWKNGKYELGAGFLDITDFVDVYALTSPLDRLQQFRLQHRRGDDGPARRCGAGPGGRRLANR